MKRTSLLAFALLWLGFVFSTTGCSTVSTPAVKPAPTYALIASVSGGGAPTDAQWATMQKDFAAMLAARGLVLITDPSKADKLIQVLFIPDLTDPNTGTSYLIAVRDNPGALIANAPTLYPAGYGFATNTSFSPFGSSLQYYGYFDDYSSSTYTTGTGAVTTPSRPDHHTTRPVDCPPNDPRHPSPGYAGHQPGHSNPPGDGGHWWNHSPSSGSDHSGGSSYSSNSSRSSADFVGPTTSYSSSASYSAPSMSFPSSSGSSSSYSAPADTSSSSSSSSSSGSSSPSDGGSQHSVR